MRLRKTVHSLVKLVFISIEYCLDNSWKLLWSLEKVGCNVFTSSLIGTTIQDGSKRERSIDVA